MSRAQSILDNVSTGILALDEQFRVTALNAAGQALLETSESRCLGQPAHKLVLRPRKLITTLEQALHSNTPQATRSAALTLLTGQQIHVDIIVTPLPEEEGSDTRLVVELLAVDRLLRISRDESLLHAQETHQAMIRGLAHEIKNPLGGVRGAAQLLARELPDEELAEYTGIIIREADRLRDLVDRLLGPKQELRLAPINIHEILEHVRHLLAAETDNATVFTRDYDPGLPEFNGDRAQLVQAVLNIMRNALQAATEPAQCEIVVRTRSQRQFTVGPKRHRLVCKIDIIDNGPGIPPELMHAVFAPMVTGRADGTGLGLSIAQNIVSQHGGVLECESRPGETRFSMYLPMELQHAQAS